MKIAKKLITRMRRAYHLRRHAHVAPLPNAAPYNPHPKTCAIVQLFNKRENILGIVAGLKRAGFDEIIVIDDGSKDDALPLLQAALTGKNEFVIRANDIFEVRSYARAIDFTRAEIVALLQDDDIPPEGDDWLRTATSLFDQHPRLAILGGRDGLSLGPAQGEIPPANFAGDDFPNVATYRLVNHDGGGRVAAPFTFVEVVNRAPMWIRKSYVLELGGIDQAFAPFQCDDVDLCLRAWLGGYQVGLYSTDFIRDVGMGGMRLFNAEAVPLQARKNWAMVYRRYGDQIARGAFSEMVAAANG